MSIWSPDPLRIPGSTFADFGQYPLRKVVIDPLRNLVTSFADFGHRIEHPVGEHPEYMSTKKTSSNSCDRHSAAQPCEYFHSRFPEGKPRKAGRRPRRAPKFDLSPFDLANPIDVANAHAMLSADWALWPDGHDGLRTFVLAAAMARRLAKSNAAGYLAKIVRDGFSKFGPADRDHADAKRILKELGA